MRQSRDMQLRVMLSLENKPSGARAMNRRIACVGEHRESPAPGAKPRLPGGGDCLFCEAMITAYLPPTTETAELRRGRVLVLQPPAGLIKGACRRVMLRPPGC